MSANQPGSLSSLDTGNKDFWGKVGAFSIIGIFVGSFLGIFIYFIVISSMNKGSIKNKFCMDANGEYVKGTKDKDTKEITCPSGSCNIRDGAYLTCNTIINEKGKIILKDQCKCNPTTNKWDCTFTGCSEDQKCIPIDNKLGTENNLIDRNAQCSNDSVLYYKSPNPHRRNFKATNADLKRCTDQKGQYYWDTNGNLRCDLPNNNSYFINRSSDTYNEDNTNNLDNTDNTDNTDNNTDNAVN